MVDKDGTADYSAVATVSLNVAEGTVKIYPTLVTGDNLYVETAGSMTQGKVEIVDMSGRILLTQKNVGSGRQQISLSKAQLSAGSYMVRVTDGNKLVAGKLVMVN
jgi:hypothetical protein